MRVCFNYNLPNLNTTARKLNGPVLADIYTGKIRAWDDKAITPLNPNVTLPHHENRVAAALGCTSGPSVRDCAEFMRSAIVPSACRRALPMVPATSCATFPASRG
jgi:hypothetical protein